MRSTVVCIFAACASLLVTSWPRTVQAQTAGPSYLTTEDVIAEFTQQGFEVSTPIQWGLASTWSRVSAVSVSDLARPGRRTAMVFIFPNTAAANLNRQAAAEQEPLDDDGGVIIERGPRIAAGYGYSVWFENVAIVQSSSDALVDPDFVAALTHIQLLLKTPQTRAD
jgi:hypothetical protein